jgi:integral membrane protein (TIGR01906 family)
MVKVVEKVTYWLFVCCLPALLITSTLRWEINEFRLYEYGFDKYQISQVTGIDRLELGKVARHLIDYFNSRIDTAQITVTKDSVEFSLFNERELIHLRDVRSLVQLDYRVQVIALSLMIICIFVLIFGFRAGWLIFVRGLFWGGILTFGLVVVLALWAIFGFEQLFILFHFVSFPNEYWMLDPARDYLIRLFPEGFFYDATLLGFAAILLKGVFISGVAFGVLKLVGRPHLEGAKPKV